MRLGFVFDTLYALTSFAGERARVPVCPSQPYVALSAEYATRLSPRSIVRRPAVVFVDVAVVSMDAARVLPNHTVLVEGGRITGLGPHGTVKIPAGALQVDGRGKYLMPGLGDMHLGGSHRIRTLAGPEQYEAFASDMLRIFLANGITSIRSLSGPDIDELPRLKQLIAMDKFPMPRIYAARSLITSDRKNLVTKPESIMAHVLASKAAGYDHLSTYFGMRASTPEEREGFDSLVAAARRVGLPLSAHAHGRGEIPLDALLTVGSVGGSTEHLPAFRTVLAPKRQLDPSKIPAYVATVKRSGIWITTTLDCMEEFYAPSAMVYQVLKALHDAGVGLLLGADEAGSALHDELEALVRAGLTPYQALVTGTRNVAQYFRLQDSSGTVAVGKWADLVLLSGNPLQDIRQTRAIAGVMVRGHWLDRATLDQRLRVIGGVKPKPYD